MFTVQQIKEAHDKVKSGADFPKYIQEIKKLGVTEFITWVKDSHTDYFGIDGYSTSSAWQYENLEISDICNLENFKTQLQLHQQGETDYFRFCKDCADNGIEKWVVDLGEMTCVYFDKTGNEILTERIPE